MTIRVAINGFGRIGRTVLRAAKRAGADVEFVAANDLGDPHGMAHLLKYDSVFGPAPFSVEIADHGIMVDGRELTILSEPDPSKLPWGDLGIDIVVESTGVFKKRDQAAQHLEAGAGRVIISSPSKDADAMFVLGVNEHTYDPDSHYVVSNASCTTNCFAQMVKVLDDSFGIEEGFITTIHAYTVTQNIVDAPHKDLRRARAGAVNLIPTTTGAAVTTGDIFEHLHGKLDGMAVRVPVANGSATDFVGTLTSTPSVDEINEAFRTAAEGPMRTTLGYTEEPLVSTDIIGRDESCVFDAGLTLAMPDGLIKAVGWYDNEWGYSQRLVDMIAMMGPS